MLPPRTGDTHRISLADPSAAEWHLVIKLRALFLFFLVSLSAAQTTSSSAASFLGFDRNDYPGDQNLPALRQTFSFAGYPRLNDSSRRKFKQLERQAANSQLCWIRIPGAVQWQALCRSEIRFPNDGARDIRRDSRGRRRPSRRISRATLLSSSIRSRADACYPSRKPTSMPGSMGHRCRVSAPGIYCSGIAAKKTTGDIVTADDIRQNAALARHCVLRYRRRNVPPHRDARFVKPPNPVESGVSFADVWQFARSPRREVFHGEMSATYLADGNCYPPGVDRREAACRSRCGHAQILRRREPANNQSM